MLIPPILEVFVLWHPDDRAGEAIAAALFDHFHGSAFAGLVGGAVEIYTRSEGWEVQGGPPRPLPFVEPLPNGLTNAAVSVVVPVLGTHLARAVQEDDDWHAYMQAMVAAAEASPEVALFGLRVDDAGTAREGRLGMLLGGLQTLDPEGVGNSALLCRDLAHSIAGFVSGAEGVPLQVFISHTKRNSPHAERDNVDDLVSLVREVIGQTHMDAFFDAADLQPGVLWEDELTNAAATSGLLVVRTDLYATREWCQREVLAAKAADMPVVVLQALSEGEERGSFLMDHVPSVSCGRVGPAGERAAIEAALNKLVDEALKRALWEHQRSRLQSYGFAWLPANAPEPTTLAAWLRSLSKRPEPGDRLFVLHPDPPMGHAELTVISDILDAAGLDGLVEILTPRTFASRGGQVHL